MKLILVIFTFIFTGTLSQISNELDVDIDDIKKQLNEQIPDLDTSKFDESQIPQMDELDVIFRNKCDTKNGNGTYDQIKESKDTYHQCVSNFVNVTELKIEIEEAKKTGSMDEVFGKYCEKYPEISKCTDEFLKSIEPCLEDNEIRSLNITMGLTQKLKDFACHKNGDRLAMFVAEGGVECITSQKEAIQQCVNQTFGSRIPTNVTPNTLPVLMFNNEDCSDFMKFRSCIAKALEKCSETTPANLVDAFFKYVKKILPCSFDDVSKLEESKNNGLTTSPINVTILTIFTIILVKFF